jgi:hypothetical protein
MLVTADHAARLTAEGEQMPKILIAAFFLAAILALAFAAGPSGSVMPPGENGSELTIRVTGFRSDGGTLIAYLFDEKDR